MNGLVEKLELAKKSLKWPANFQPKIAITLGSGLSKFADHLEVLGRQSFSSIEGFVPPSVDGHPGELIFTQLGSTQLCVMTGRVHHYEGHPYSQVIFPTQLMGWLGCKTLIVTNAAGSLSKEISPGTIMVIKDHINLTGQNPLVGLNDEKIGPRFPDMSEPYSKELQEIALKALAEEEGTFAEGVYCGVTGPTYETAAEIQYMNKIGGHAVGMSTVPEVIAAAHMGIRVLGLSCVTNFGTGLSSEKLTHEDVKETARKVESYFIGSLKRMIPRI